MSLPEVQTQQSSQTGYDLPIHSAHLIGICGSGMKPLAQALLATGVTVTGSDPSASPDHPLAAAGARLYPEHLADNIAKPDVVVFSTAIADDNPEMLAARERGIPILHRSDLLAWFLRRKESVLVAGTHGKTTTTTMVSLLLEAAGYDPWSFVGGRVERWGGNLRFGGDRWAVAEADESDGTFLRLPRDHAIITNIEAEHLNYWGDEERMFRGFHEFAQSVPIDGRLVIGIDDEGSRRLVEELGRGAVTYALGDSSADYFAVINETTGSGSTFDLYIGARKAARIRLAVPGNQNIQNAVGAYALAHGLGVEPATVASALAEFQGVDRRFTRRTAPGGFLVVDDYGHHPTEIRATMLAARRLAEERHGRLIAVFQPHRYTRTQNFFDKLPKAFEAADQVLVMEIYGSGEAPIPGVSGETVTGRLAGHLPCPVVFTPDFAAVQKTLRDSVKNDDIVLLLGAGSITKLRDLLCSC